MWKVGQKVVCINNKRISSTSDNPPPLKLGAIYVIKEINKCVCGILTFNVGLKNTKDCIRCHDCGYLKESTVWFVSSKRFSPVQYSGNALSEILSLKLSPEREQDVEVKEINQPEKV